MHSKPLFFTTSLVSHNVGLMVTAGNTATLAATLWGNGVEQDGAGTLLTGTVNLWGAPAFMAPAAGDCYLTPDSAAVDQGIDAGVTHDVDNDLRPEGAGPDLGADELGAKGYRIFLPLVLR